MQIINETFPDPLSVPVDNSAKHKLELSDLQVSDELHATYQKHTLLDFYRTLPETFANLKVNALVHTSVCGSTYFCKLLLTITDETEKE